jgi:hypothetical protein
MKAEKPTTGPLQKRVDRRAFVKSAGIVGVGIGGASWFAGKLGMFEAVPGAKSLGLGPSAVQAADISDVDILNFALNLEYLEAEFYTVATTGRTIDQIGIATSGTGNPGATTGGKQVSFEADGQQAESSGKLRAVAEELAFDEQQHVQLLRTALGSAAVAKPAINLDALGVGFDNFKQFLALARGFEDVGVSAYGGAAPLISDKTILATAARIALTEALHSGNIRLLVAENNIQAPDVDKLDVLPPPARTKFFTVDDNALAIVRVPSQVLHIVYGKWEQGVSSGGFFPMGLNGTITTG